MFIIDPNPTFTWPVEITLSGGKKGEISFEFRYLARPERDAWIASSAAGKADVKLLDEIIAGWTGVVDANRNPVEYSPAALTDLLSRFYRARFEIYIGYLKGLEGASRKN